MFQTLNLLLLIVQAD